MSRTSYPRGLRFAAVAALAALLAALPAVPAWASATPTITAVPSVTHVGRTITVRGTGLEDSTAITLGGTALGSVTPSADGSAVTATVPAGATSGFVHVHTSSPGDVTSADSVTVAPAPTLSGLAGAVGDRAAVLTWTAGGTGAAVVRDVTGVPDPVTPTDGRAVAVSGLQARDTAFTNTESRRYAVWAADADGTTSVSPTEVTVATAGLVPTTLTLATSVPAVPYGRAVTLAGTLTREGGVPSPNQPVEIYGRTGGLLDTRLLRRVLTAADGTLRTSITPSRSTDYQLRFAGDAFSAASGSPHHSVLVLPRITARFAPPAIVLHETSALTGQVVPPLSGALLTVQQWLGGAWHDVTRTRTASNGTYAVPMSPRLGVYTFRVVLPGSAALLRAASNAAALRVDARDLVDGLQGDDVLALQHFLASLHYEPGTLNGYFGYDLHHAVMTFQKVERLPVTGRWTKVERTRSGRPTAWTLRYPGPGRAVEIDITRQVLVLSQAGVVVKIIDVSTGTEQPYTFQGVSDIAHTPRGRFSIYYKIDGIRISKLGELYKPNYFFKGWAIHGSGSVPNYPASHGCVRITNPNADRLFPVLVKGTPVTLYDE